MARLRPVRGARDGCCAVTFPAGDGVSILLAAFAEARPAAESSVLLVGLLATDIDQDQTSAAKCVQDPVQLGLVS